MKLYVASDHAGFTLKQALVARFREWGHEVEDLGPASADRVDYPDYAAKVARAVAGDTDAKGVVCCGSGLGVAIAANKIPGIRAVCCWDERSAQLSRQHNDANVLTLGERLIPQPEAEAIAKAWLEAEFEGGRHAGRVEKITALER